MLGPSLHATASFHTVDIAATDAQEKKNKKKKKKKPNEKKISWQKVLL